MKITVKLTQIETYEIPDIEADPDASLVAAAMMHGAEILRQIREGEISPEESDIGEITIIDIEEGEYQEEQEEMELEVEPSDERLEEPGYEEAG